MFYASFFLLLIWLSTDLVINEITQITQAGSRVCIYTYHYAFRMLL